MGERRGREREGNGKRGEEVMDIGRLDEGGVKRVRGREDVRLQKRDK